MLFTAHLSFMRPFCRTNHTRDPDIGLVGGPKLSPCSPFRDDHGVTVTMLKIASAPRWDLLKELMLAWMCAAPQIPGNALYSWVPGSQLLTHRAKLSRLLQDTVTQAHKKCDPVNERA